MLQVVGRACEQGKDYRSVGVPLASPACLPCPVTVVEPHAELPSETEASSLDDLVSDCAEVTRHLAEVPRPRRTLTIPDRAVGVVADLDTYGD